MRAQGLGLLADSPVTSSWCLSSWRDVVAALDPVAATDPRLLLWEDGALSVYYAPWDWVKAGKGGPAERLRDVLAQRGHSGRAAGGDPVSRPEALLRFDADRVQPQPQGDPGQARPRHHRRDDGHIHLFPDSEDLGRGAIDAILAQALAEQTRNEEAE